MKLIRFPIAVAMVVLVQVGGCTRSSPVGPGGAGGGGELDTLAVAAELILNNGSRFSASEAIQVSVVAIDADSVALFNLYSNGVTGVRWFRIVGDTLSISDWNIGPGEGQKSVGVVLRKEGFVDSDTLTTSIVLDQTPPHVLPEIVFPADGATSVPSITAFRWLPSVDEFCPAESLVYRLAIGRSAPPVIEEWSGRGNSTVLNGLGKLATWYWRLTVEDAAGNVTEGVNGQFSTWDVDLPVFNLVDSGAFLMGSPESEPRRGWDESQHHVTLTRDFYMGRTNITVGQFVQLANWALENGRAAVDADEVIDNVTGSGEMLVNLSRPTFYELESGGGIGTTVDPARICYTTTWWGAAAICDWLNELAGFERLYDRSDDWRCNGGDVYGAVGFRLPTEAEWEYTCRAGTTTEFASGSMGEDECWDVNLNEIGWYCGNYLSYDFFPARLNPNSWGFYDMQGGASDWCYDKWAAHTTTSQVDPVVDVEGAGRVARGTGGDFPGYNDQCRSAARVAWDEDNISSHCSIRLVFSADGSN